MESSCTTFYYTVSQKTIHFHNFAKCWPIFKICPLTDSLVNIKHSLMNRSLDIKGKQRITYTQKQNIQAHFHSKTVNWSKSTWFSSLMKQSKDDASTWELGKASQMSQIRLLKKYWWALTLEWCLYSLYLCPLVWVETERSKNTVQRNFTIKDLVTHYKVIFCPSNL